MVVARSFSGLNIITSTNVDVTDPAFVDRITLFRSTASLELRNLTLGDTGKYTVMLTSNSEAAQRGNCRLTTYGKLMHHFDFKNSCTEKAI